MFNAFKKKKQNKKVVVIKEKAKKDFQVRLIDHSSGFIETFEYPASMPRSRIAVDIQQKLGHYAYDVKLSAESETSVLYVAIASTIVKQVYKENLVVPVDYAILWVAGYTISEPAVVVIPYETDTVIGVIIDHTVVSVYTEQVSLFSESSIATLSKIIKDIIMQFQQEFMVVINDIYIANSPRQIPISTVNILSSENQYNVNAITVDPSTYNGELTLNSKYSLIRTKPISRRINEIELDKRKMIITALALTGVFLWTYFPVNSVISYANSVYLKAQREARMSIVKIEKNKAQFEKLITEVQNKVQNVNNYKQAYAKFHTFDAEKVFSVIMSSPKIKSIRMEGNVITINALFSSPSELDAYIDKLLLSGYFTQIMPMGRSEKTSLYNISVTVGGTNEATSK